MIVISFTLLAVLLVVMQTTICMLHPLWLLAPDFYYILVAFLAYRLDLFRSLFILFFLGCVLDVSSGTILGMYSLLCFVAFFLLRFLSQKMPVSESLYQVPFIGVSYLVVSWFIYIIATLFEPGGLVEWSWWRMIVRAGLIVLFAYPLFCFFEYIHKKMSSGLFSWKRLTVKSSNRYRAS